MISKETPFLDILKPENLKKVKIDSVLIPYFVRAMFKMQQYFEEKGLLNANHYGLYFEKLLLGKNPYTIMLSDNVWGNFDGDFNKSYRTIRINRDYFEKQILKENGSETIEALLCHEFIHFLVLADLPFIEQTNGTFVQTPARHVHPGATHIIFLNEAYTQALTKCIYPNSVPAYEDEVNMLRLIQNVFNVEEDDFFAFLRGQMPGVTEHSSEFGVVLNYLNMYWKEGKFQGGPAKENKYYKAAVDTLVKMFTDNVKREIETFSFENTTEFLIRILPLRDALPLSEWHNSEKLVEQLNSLYVKKFAQVYDMPAEIERQMNKDINRMAELLSMLANNGSHYYLLDDNGKVLRGYVQENCVTLLNNYSMAFQDGAQIWIDNQQFNQDGVGFCFAYNNGKLTISKDNQILFEKFVGGNFWRESNRNANFEFSRLQNIYNSYQYKHAKTIGSIARTDRMIYKIDKLDFEKMPKGTNMFVSTNLAGEFNLWIEQQGTITKLPFAKAFSKKEGSANMKKIAKINKKIIRSVDVEFANGNKFVVGLEQYGKPVVFECSNKNALQIPAKSQNITNQDMVATAKYAARKPIENLSLPFEKTF